MSWNCAVDGKAEIPDDVSVCPACGSPRPSSLVPAGSDGRVESRLNLSVGSSLLEGVVGHDAVYCATRQYDISRNGDDGRWYLQAFNGSTKNLTAVNGTVCSDELIPLENGDVISVCSKSDSAKTAAAVTVEIAWL